MAKAIILGIKTAGESGELVLLSNEKTSRRQLVLDSTLSEKIIVTLEQLLTKAGIAVQDLDKIVIYRGPGSFTSLRIGHAVANTLSMQLDIPIAGITEKELGAKKFEDILSLVKGKKGIQVIPFYGSPPKITKPKKKY